MKVEFWSSSEYSGFMLGLLRELRASGVEAVQQSHIKEATYRKSNTRCARMLLRFRQYVVYPISLLGHLLWRRLTGRSADFVVISTNTFYAPLLATWVHPQVVHLVYDLFPEALIHSGKLRAHSPTVRLVRWITARTMQRAAINVFLGERLLQHAQAVHPYLRRPVVIPVGADQSLFPASPKEGLRSAGAHRTESERQDAAHVATSPLSQPGPKILYCGNFGNMHDSATLFDFWRQAAVASVDRAAHSVGGATTGAAAEVWPLSYGCTFQFCCSGAKRTALDVAHAALPSALQARIQLSGSLADAAWIEAMAVADVALVTMVAGSETVVLPSKAYSAMMAGQALLVVAPEASDLVDLVKRADCGWWVEPGDVAGFSKAVSAIEIEPEALLRKREAAFKYAHAQFGQERLAALWQAALLGDVAPAAGVPRGDGAQL